MPDVDAAKKNNGSHRSALSKCVGGEPSRHLRPLLEVPTQACGRNGGVLVVDDIDSSRHAGEVDRRPIVFLAYPGLQILDLTGPREVFAIADQVAGERRPKRTWSYELRVVGTVRSPIHSESGLAILADSTIADNAIADSTIADNAIADNAIAANLTAGAGGTVCAQMIDTLVIPGGATTAARQEPITIEWIRAASRSARRTASVCSGAFLLAEAGLLDGKRVTTHWARADRLRAEFPSIDVDADPIYLRFGNIWTSAGITAGIDLALALVEDDLGPEIAQETARWLVMFVRRAGGQSQFATAVWTEAPKRQGLAAVLSAVHEEPCADHSLAAMARRASMSPRHFGRCLRAETGESPARYVDRVRIESARRLLETTDLALPIIAERVGFGTAETLRRAFHRHLGVAPADYRNRFSMTLERTML